MRRTFVVGRLTSRASEIIMVEGVRPSPIPGPWTLRAMVRATPAGKEPRGRPGPSTSH